MTNISNCGLINIGGVYYNSNNLNSIRPLTKGASKMVFVSGNNVETRTISQNADDAAKKISQTAFNNELMLDKSEGWNANTSTKVCTFNVLA